MVKLRLTRLGRRKKPVYRIAAMEELTQRDGKAIAYLGTFESNGDFNTAPATALEFFFRIT